MAENLLSDAKLRAATFERDGHYLADGGGLRIRLKPQTRTGERGARLAEYHFKIKTAEGYKNGAIHLGTLGEPFTDPEGKVRPFTLADARIKRDEARELVAKGIDPREAGRLARMEHVEAQRQRLAELESRRTVREGFNRWRELYLEAKNPDGTFAHRKDGGQFVADLFERHVLPSIGALPLEEIRRGTVTEVLDGITAAGKRRTANMALSLLRQFFRWCAVRDWMPTDPTLGIDKKNAGGSIAPRERNLSSLEIIELRDKLPALPERLRAVVWLLLATGARVGELSNARRDAFDLDAAEWSIPAEDSKNGDPHLVHLSAFAVAQVRALLAPPKRKTKKAAPPKPSAWLLPGRDPEKPISPKLVTKLIGDRQRDTPMQGRTKQAGALVLARGKWTPHDLRRTMASRMQDLGIRPDVIERCLNHRPEGIVAVYQRADLLPERRAAFDAWGAELARLMTADAGNVTELRAAPVRKTHAKAAA